MEWEDLGELLVLGGFAAGFLYLREKYSRKIDKAQLMNRAISNPASFSNSAGDIMKCYDKETREFMSGGIKKISMHSHEHTTTYEVMVSDRLMTKYPLYVGFSYPAIAEVPQVNPDDPSEHIQQ